MTEKKLSNRVDPTKRLAELRDGGAGKSASEDAEPLALELDDEQEAFSTLSADRQQKVMLELRFQAGNARAFAYSYLVSLDFNPSEGIRMDFSGYEIRIAGRNLRPLFAGLVAQRVAFVVEMDDLHAEVTLPKDTPVVTGIEVVESK
jgi:hypothetical protein